MVFTFDATLAFRTWDCQLDLACVLRLLNFVVLLFVRSISLGLEKRGSGGERRECVGRSFGEGRVGVNGRERTHVVNTHVAIGKPLLLFLVVDVVVPC